MTYKERVDIICISTFILWGLVIVSISMLLNPIGQTTWFITGIATSVLLIASDIKKEKKVSPTNFLAFIVGPVGLLSLLSIMLYVSIWSRRVTRGTKSNGHIIPGSGTSSNSVCNKMEEQIGDSG